MRRWLKVPNRDTKDGIFAINVDHIIVYHDMPVDKVAWPDGHVQVTLTDGSKRHFGMTATRFGQLLVEAGAE